MASLSIRNTNYVHRAYKLRRPIVQSILYDFSRSDGFVIERSQQRAASSLTSSASKSRVPGSQVKVQAQSRHAQRQTTLPLQPKSSTAIATPGASVPHSERSLESALRDLQNKINAICANTRLPEDSHVLEVVDKAYQFSNILVFGRSTAPDEEAVNIEEEDADNSKDIFSELDEPPQQLRKQDASSGAASPTQQHARERSAQALCQSLYTLMKDPKILISEPVLSTYVRIICQLGSPEYLPEIFFLYANKPQPIPGSNPVQFRNPSPNSPKNAIPQELSDVALDTAVLQRDLALAVALIDTTVATRAFRLAKFVRKASLPLAFVGSTPIAAYAAADWVANWQNSLDPQMAKAITLMGSAAYIGTLSTIGFVAVTTWNDHHERVRWTEGTPLRYRWMREEERLYFDRIAMAWGFQRKRRRGEEMGGLWEELREECGVRGMVLDKSDLLPGMQ